LIWFPPWPRGTAIHIVLEIVGTLMDTKALWAEQNIRLKRCRDGAMMYMINDRYIGRALDKYGEICRGEVIFLSQIIRSGMTILDVGANIGLLTLPFARLVRPGGRVIAFEPQRIVYQILCGNLALNAIDNVFAHNSAVGRQGGSIALSPTDYTQVGNFGGVAVGASFAGETVPLVTIDSLALPSCEFMKIDVEGMELDVLAGAGNTLQRFRPRLFVENDRPEKSAALIEHLLGLDYRLYWFFAGLYSADNFFGDQEDIFPGIVSDNMVCIPRTGPLSITVQGLTEITSTNASPPRREADKS
jgi:FkbM family methyltransferase